MRASGITSLWKIVTDLEMFCKENTDQYLPMNHDNPETLADNEF